MLGRAAFPAASCNSRRVVGHPRGTDVSSEAVFLARCCKSLSLEHVHMQTVFLRDVVGVSSLKMLFWRQCLYGDVVRVSQLLVLC